MKKFLRVSFIPLLGCTLLIAAACGGNTSSHRQEDYRQERTIAPDFDHDVPDVPKLPEIPRRPDDRKPKISRLPYMKESKDEDSRKNVPVPYSDI